MHFLKKEFQFDQKFWKEHSEDARFAMEYWWSGNYHWMLGPNSLYTEKDFWYGIRDAGLRGFEECYRFHGKRLLAGDMPGYTRVVPASYPDLPLSIVRPIVEALIPEFQKRLEHMREEKEKRDV